MSIYCTVVPKIGFDTAKNGPSKVWATNNQPPMPTWNRIKRLWVLLPDQREDAYAYKRSVEDDPYPRERNWTGNATANIPSSTQTFESHFHVTPAVDN